MKNLKNWFLKHGNKANVLASFAMAFVVLAANGRCSYCFHQPKLPEAARRFQKSV